MKAKAASESNLTFTLNDDGQSYSVTGCNTSASGGIVILDTYTGLPVTTIGDYAIINVYNLTTVTIPDSITNIGCCIFRDCNNLQSIIVDSANSNYVSVNGVLFNKNMTELIKCPTGGSEVDYTIPDSVTSICDCAFYNCGDIESITIPESVISIGDYALSNSTNLTKVTILNRNVSVNDNAFEGCNKVVVYAVCGVFSNDGVDYPFAHYDIHNMTEGWVLESEATCTQDGKEFNGCWDCEYREYRAIPAHHVYPENGNVIVQPTTTEPGLQIKVCTVCREHAIYEEIPVLEAPTTPEVPTLKQLNGQWVYASGSEIITDYTGFVEYYGGWYYITNGYLDWSKQ